MAIGVFTGIGIVFSSVGVAHAETSVGDYIIAVPDTAQNELAQTLDSLDVAPTSEFSHVIDGATAELSASDISALTQEIPDVVIVPNGKRKLLDTQTSATWGLDTLDQSSRWLNSSYQYPPSAGTGVDVYVIDTGLAPWTYGPGGELAGRVRGGRAFIDGVTSTNAEECLPSSPAGQTYADGGHGTHVAGTIASKSYGVAKRATIVPLRVFGCPTWNVPSNSFVEPSASDGDILAALDYAVADHQATKRPGVINLSLGGPCIPTCATDLLNLAVNQTTKETVVGGQTIPGLTVTVAAGNETQNACKTSPASAADVITVGATDSLRAFSYFSNYGPCVDIFAPGENIKSLNAYYGLNSSSATALMSGTSMASPHVAGVAALYLALHPLDSPATVRSALTANALSGAVSDPFALMVNTPNVFANITFLNNTIVSIGAPGSVVAQNPTTSSVRLSWSPASLSGGISPSDYRVQYRATGQSAWTAFAHPPLGATTATKVTGLTRGQTYQFRVAAMLGSQVGSFSSPITQTVLSGLASAPVGLATTSVAPNAISLTWQAPTGTNGSPITDYRIEYRLADASSWTTFVDGVSTSRTATVTGLTPGKAYTLRCFAVTKFGVDSMAASNIVSVSTLSGIPSSPQNIAITVLSGTSVSASWQAPSTLNGGTISDYYVFVRPVSSTTWTRYSDPVSTGTNVTISGLTPGVQYQLGIRAKTAQGLSPFALTSFST